MIDVTADVLQVSGPMVIDTATRIQSAGEAALAGNSIRSIDLAAVTEADSSAVAVILSWTRLAQQRGQSLQIVHSPDSIRSLANLYGVAEFLPLA